MAIGNPIQLGARALATGGGSTTVNFGAQTVPANSLVVVVVLFANGNGDPGTTETVSDGSHTYTKDKTQIIGTATARGRISIHSFYDAAGGSKTVTVTTPAVNIIAADMFTISGAATSAYLDQSGASGAALATDLSVTTAGNVSQADEVSISFYAYDNSAAPTTWPGTSYTSLDNFQNALRIRSLLIEYRNGLTSGATETAGGTLSGTSDIGRVIVTYKGAGAVVAGSSPRIIVNREAQRRASRW